MQVKVKEQYRWDRIDESVLMVGPKPQFGIQHGLESCGEGEEKYDYILPQAQETLTESQALDLDQQAAVMDTTYHTARAKQAFIDRCPKAFIEQEANEKISRALTYFLA